jgi:hypothetical protein
MIQPDEVSADEHLLRFVAGRDVECPGCQYNVRDLKITRCPECGDELELSLRLAEPRQGSLIAGLVGLAAGAGFGGLLLVYIGIILFLSGRGGPPNDFFGITCTGFVVHAIGLGIWIKNWRNIRRARPRTRTFLVALCWFLPLAFVASFSIVIR